MRVLQLHRGATFGFWLFLFAVSCCYGRDETVEVVGFVEHTDFAQSKIRTCQTFSGFYVTIGCKSADGKLKTMGSGELDEGEKFKVILPQEIIKDGVIKEECYAQLHNASDSPCPLHNSQEALKITFHYKAKGKRTISQTGNLNFSPITCTSKFLWHFHMFPPVHVWWPPLVGTPFQHPPTPPYQATPPPPRIPPSPPATSQLPPIPAPENSLPPPTHVSNTPISPPSTIPPPLPKSKILPPSSAPTLSNPSLPSAPVSKIPPFPKSKHLPPAAAPTLENPAPPGTVSKQPQPPPTAAAAAPPHHIPTFIIPKPPPIPTFNKPISTPAPPIPALN